MEFVLFVFFVANPLMQCDNTLGGIMGKLLFANEVFAIQGAIFEVSKEMGIGFLEAVYQECLIKEFALRAIPCAAHQELNLHYKGERLIQTYRPDFICYGQIIVELKACSEISNAHRAQVLNYLRATNLSLGLIVNFGAYPKAQVERLAL